MTGWSRVRIQLRQLIRFGTWSIPFTPLCQCLSEETLKTVGPFYLVSMPGEVKDPTGQSALEMCNLSWTPPPTLRDDTSSWTTLEISRKTFVHVIL